MLKPANGAAHCSPGAAAAEATTNTQRSAAPWLRTASMACCTVAARWPTATYTQISSECFWLMMASSASEVLPVARSPMISSRWPRPMANSASTISTPVSTGSLTAARSMIAGAGRSIGRRVSARIGSSRSSGRPSGSTTRPSRPGPTGTCSTSPVPCTSLPAAMAALSSSSTTEISSLSRLRAKPRLPSAKRSSSSRRTPGRPLTRAMPSATWTTRPISPASACSGVRASAARLRASQSADGARSGVGVVMATQLPLQARQIGAETVAHHHAGAFQLETGDQRRLDRRGQP
ncbi:hypothetical protein D3C85_847560 [compost metagenome]